MADDRPAHKKRRNPRACDACSRRGVKCRPSSDNQARCQNCQDFDEACTIERPIRKRGPQSQTPSARRVTATRSPGQNHSSRPNTVGTLPATPRDESQTQWKLPSTATQALIMDLTEIFFEVVYPVFPLFHRPTLVRRVSRAEYLTDRTLYAALCALCALTSARVRDGALYSPAWTTESLQGTTSEAFFEAAAHCLPKDAPLTQHLGYMQTCVLLALTSIQYGNARTSQYYVNLYHTFVAVGSLHDEDQWPRGIGIVEVEERRRLFWSTYTLDVFTSVIWKSVVRSSEAVFNVGYPAERNDETFSDAGWANSNLPGSQNNLSWWTGWNFVTDVYRILEHTLHKFRRLDSKTPHTPAISVLFNEGTQSQSAVLEHVMDMYDKLPAVFKCTRPITNNLGEDLFSFQAANIAASVQLLRMVLFTTEGSTVAQKCQIASEVIGAFANVPVAYLRAISSPLLHHLTGIGVILSSAFRDGLSESSYGRIRTVLLELAELISHLEEGLCYSAGTSEKLRTQVKSIDEYWATQRHSGPVSMVASPQEGTPALQQIMDNVQDVEASSRDAAELSLSNDNSPHFYFPPELLDSWSWVFENGHDTGTT